MDSANKSIEVVNNPALSLNVCAAPQADELIQDHKVSGRGKNLRIHSMKTKLSCLLKKCLQQCVMEKRHFTTLNNIFQACPSEAPDIDKRLLQQIELKIRRCPADVLMSL
jgi:hypothetical protein